MKSLSAKIQKISKGLPRTVLALIAKKKITVEDDSAISEVKRGELFHMYTASSKFYFVDTEGDEYHIFQITQSLFNQLKSSHTEVQYYAGRTGHLRSQFEASRKKTTSMLKRNENLRKIIEQDTSVDSLLEKKSEQVRLLAKHAFQMEFNKNLTSLKRIMDQWKLHRQYLIRPQPHTYDFMEDFILVWNTLVEMREAGKADDVPAYLTDQIQHLEEKWGIDFHGNPLQDLQERYTKPATVHDINRLRPGTQGPKQPTKNLGKILKFKPKTHD